MKRAAVARDKMHCKSRRMRGFIVLTRHPGGNAVTCQDEKASQALDQEGALHAQHLPLEVNVHRSHSYHLEMVQNRFCQSLEPVRLTPSSPFLSRAVGWGVPTFGRRSQAFVCGLAFIAMVGNGRAATASNRNCPAM